MPGKLSTLGKNEERLRGKLSERGIHDPAQIFYAGYHDGKLWLHRYQQAWGQPGHQQA